MSVQVEQLSKVYGSQYAVNNISFSLEAGEIVGFLGPNGAGKSTTMKIATCFIPPTSGTVHVAGFDVMQHPMRVKQITGYLPEHNPLYLDMYVHEYLRFIGGLYAVKNLRSRVGEMIELCGLTREQNKKIEVLSKGYRQRVGLAQALLHDPQVLILDEPTSGLDPNQILEIRKLIKDISHNKTVLFSTHIMQEVSALCDRVIVINKGELVADATLQELNKLGSDTTVVTVEFETAIAIEQLRALPDIIDVEEVAQYKYRIKASGQTDIRPMIFRFAADNSLSLVGLKQEEHSLETIFKELTSRV